MFDFFNTRKIAALETQIELLNHRIEEMENKFAKVEEQCDISNLESTIESMIERELDNVDFDDKARDALESLVSYARVSIDF